MAIEYAGRFRDANATAAERQPVRIPYLVPDLPTSEEVLPYLREVDQNRWYTNFGPLSQRLRDGLWRQFFAEQVSSNQLVLCASGTAAIELGLHGLGLAPGARVLLPNLTFPATALAVIRAGMVPVLADVDASTWQLTPAIAKALHSEGHQYDAVLPVATYGLSQDLRGWSEFKSQYGIPVLIDAAPALATQEVGLDIPVAFSLHATKAFGIGEGGLLVETCEQNAVDANRFINFGFDAGRVIVAGTNAKLSEYHAAVGLAQLHRWSHIRESGKRRMIAYRDAISPLQGVGALRLQFSKGSELPTSMVLALEGGIAVDRVQRAMSRAGIETRRLYWPALHEQPAIMAHSIDLAGVMTGAADKDLAENLLALPLHNEMTLDQVGDVVAMLYEALDISMNVQPSVKAAAGAALMR